MPTNSDLYFTFRPELPHPIFCKVSATSNYDPLFLKYSKANIKTLIPADKKKLFYDIDKMTKVHHLYIPFLVAIEIITFVHNAGNPRFSQCFKIIICSWPIQGLTQMLWSYI